MSRFSDTKSDELIPTYKVFAGGGRARRYVCPEWRAHAALRTPKEARFLSLLPADLSGWLVVLYVRVSTQKQANDKTLDGQQTEMEKILIMRGAKVLRVFSEVVQGYLCPLSRQLAQAIAYARKMSAVLVAESTDRLLRSPYGVKFPAEGRDFDFLMNLAADVRIFTSLDPMMPYLKQHNFHVKRGQAAKGNKGGRPKPDLSRKKFVRAWFEPLAIGLMQAGMEPVQISRKLNLPKSTVWGWLDSWVRRFRTKNAKGDSCAS